MTFPSLFYKRHKSIVLIRLRDVSLGIYIVSQLIVALSYVRFSVDLFTDLIVMFTTIVFSLWLPEGAVQNVRVLRSYGRRHAPGVLVYVYISTEKFRGPFPV